MAHEQLARLLAQMEWDALSHDRLRAQAQAFGSVTEGLDELCLRRDVDYHLACTLAHKHVALRLDNHLKAGEFTNGHDLHAQVGMEQIHLEGAVAMRNEFTASDEGVRAIAHLHALRIKRTFNEGVPARLTEWYLGGPRSASFSRWTTRAQSFEFSRAREDLEPSQHIEPMTNARKTRDHILLNPCEGVTLLVGQVPELYGPEWSKNICIEYPKATIDRDVRAAVMEGIGLFFGRRLLPIGESLFGVGGELLMATHWSPPDHNPRRLSSASDLRLYAGDAFELEDPLNAFLRAFLRVRTELDLSRVVHTLWLAATTPLGADLAIYGAALERLMNAWYRCGRSKSRGVYMSKDDFERLLGAELDAAASKLNLVEYGDRIVRRLAGAFNMGVNERLENFFAELDLPLSASERATLKARNLSAHGGGTPNMFKGRLHKQSYRVLINRALLRMVGHEGTYTDYASAGYPDRPLSEPSGEAEAR